MKHLKASLIGVSVLALILFGCGKDTIPSPPKEPDPVPVQVPVVSVSGPTAPLWYGGDTILTYSVSPGTNTSIDGVLQNKTSGSFQIVNLTAPASVVVTGFNGTATSTKTAEVKVYDKNITDFCKKQGWWKFIKSEYLDTTSNTWIAIPTSSVQAKTTFAYPDGSCDIDLETPPAPVSHGSKWRFGTVGGKLTIEWPVQSNGSYFVVEKLIAGLSAPAKDTIVNSYTVVVQGRRQYWRETAVK